MTKTKQHYDDIAEGYNNLRETGFVGYLVKKESVAIMDRLNVKKGDLIFDAGCGSGFYSQKITDLGGQVLGVDLSPEMVEVCKKKGIQAIQGDLTEIKLGKTFKKILCAGSLEFIQDQTKLFASLTAHLEKDGEVFCLFPRNNWAGWIYWLYHRSHGVSVRLFSKSFCEKIAFENGLQIINISYPEPLTKLITFRKK